MNKNNNVSLRNVVLMRVVAIYSTDWCFTIFHISCLPIGSDEQTNKTLVWGTCSLCAGCYPIDWCFTSRAMMNKQTTTWIWETYSLWVRCYSVDWCFTGRIMTVCHDGETTAMFVWGTRSLGAGFVIPLTNVSPPVSWHCIDEDKAATTTLV